MQSKLRGKIVGSCIKIPDFQKIKTQSLVQKIEQYNEIFMLKKDMVMIYAELEVKTG